MGPGPPDTRTNRGLTANDMRAVEIIKALGYPGEIEQARRVSTDGNVSYFNLNAPKVTENLALLIPEAHGLSYSSRHEIAHRALFGLTAPDPVSAEMLWRKCIDELHSFLRKPLLSFHVYTTLAIRRSLVGRSAHLEHTRILILTRFPRRVERSFGQLDPGAQGWGDQVQVQQPIRLGVKARMPADAVETASADLDFLRGLWNWRINRRIVYRTTSERAPFNTIRIGPRYTVHRHSGTLVTTQYWYEPSYVPSRNPPTISSAQWSEALSEELRVRRLLKAVPYAEDLKRAFTTYARALDTNDHQVSLLRLWGVLEGLVGVQDANHKVIARRTANLFDDTVAASAELNLIREQRNRLAHAGTATGSEDHLCMMLRRYLDALFKIHLGMGRHFESLARFGEFLDLPRDHVLLRRAIAERRLALRFHSPRA